MLNEFEIGDFVSTNPKLKNKGYMIGRVIEVTNILGNHGLYDSDLKVIWSNGFSNSYKPKDLMKLDVEKSNGKYLLREICDYSKGNIYTNYLLSSTYKKGVINRDGQVFTMNNNTYMRKYYYIFSYKSKKIKDILEKLYLEINPTKVHVIFDISSIVGDYGFKVSMLKNMKLYNMLHINKIVICKKDIKNINYLTVNYQ